MSIKLSSLGWACDALKEDSYELVAMLALADWANDDGEAWPSVAHLCAKAGMSERHWKRVRKNLIRKGVLEVFYKAGAGRKDRKTNKYKIIIASPNEGDGLSPSFEGDQTVVTRGTSESHEGDQRRRGIRQYRSVNKEPSAAAPAHTDVRKRGSQGKRKARKRAAAAPFESVDFEEFEKIYPTLDIKREFAECWRNYPGDPPGRPRFKNWCDIEIEKTRRRTKPNEKFQPMPVYRNEDALAHRKVSDEEQADILGGLKEIKKSLGPRREGDPPQTP